MLTNATGFNLDSLFMLIHLGGPVIALLIAMSIIGLVVVLIKCWQFASLGVPRRQFIETSLSQWRAGECDTALARLEAQRHPIAKALATAMEGVQSRMGIAAVREEAARVGARQLSILRSYFRPLEVIGSLAPLLGLLGTVLGMIDAFKQLAGGGSQVDPSVLSAGIWQALLTTAAGLIVAIPAVVVLNWFERITERVHADMEDALTRFFTAHEREKAESHEKNDMPAAVTQPFANTAERSESPFAVRAG